MSTTAQGFLIAALVAATFGFGGIETTFAGPARGLALLMFLGFGFCILFPALRAAREIAARRNMALRNEPGGDAEPVVL